LRMTIRKTSSRTWWCGFTGFSLPLRPAAEPP